MEAKSAHPRKPAKFKTMDAALTLFEALDVNHDGVVSREEMTSRLREFDPDFSESKLDEIFKKLNVHDEKMDKKQFCASFSEYLSSSKAPESSMPLATSKSDDMKNAFSWCDLDGDGKISLRELQTAMNFYLGRHLREDEIADITKTLETKHVSINEIPIEVFSVILQDLINTVKANPKSPIRSGSGLLQSVRHGINMTQEQLEDEVLALRNENETLQNKINSLNERLEKHYTTFVATETKLLQEIESLKDQLKQSEKTNKSMTKQREAMIEQFNADIQTLREKLNEPKERARKVESPDNKSELLKQQCDKLQAAMEKLKHENAELSGARRTSEAEITRLRGELASRTEDDKKQIQNLESQIGRLRADLVSEREMHAALKRSRAKEAELEFSSSKHVSSNEKEPLLRSISSTPAENGQSTVCCCCIQ